MTTEQEQAVQPESDWVFVGEDEQAKPEQEQVEAQEETEQEESSEESELTLVIDGEEVSPTSDDEVELPDDAPNWARDLRHKYKETVQDAKALKQQLEQYQSAPKQAEPELKERPKPTLESCDFDTDKYEADLSAWADEQVQVKAQKSKAESEQAELKRQFEAKQADYIAKKQTISKSAPDYQQAESKVLASLSIEAQNQLLMYADDPAAIVLALGRNDGLLKIVSELQKDPFRLAVKIGELNKSAKFAPKAKQSFSTEPKVKASITKPQSEADARFSRSFPDAEFK